MVAARSEIMERMRAAFRAEALDLLPELDPALLAMEMEPQNAALVNRVFRAMHTVKGSGATAGFTHLAHFAHRVEEAFDLARSGKLPVTSELIDCGLKACDVIREILDMEDEEREAKGERAVTDAVLRLLPSATSPIPNAPVPAASSAGLAAYEIVFKPNGDLFRSGTDPLSLLDELRDLGTATITARADALPSLADLAPESCYLSWQILLVTEHNEEVIRDVFLFVEDDCQIDIHRLPSQPESIAFLLLPHQDRPSALQRLVQAYVAIGDASLKRMEHAPGGLADELAAYSQAMHRLAAMAMCGLLRQIEETALCQTRILARVSRVGRSIGCQDRFRLRQGLELLHHSVAELGQQRRESHA